MADYKRRRGTAFFCVRRAMRWSELVLLIISPKVAQARLIERLRLHEIIISQARLIELAASAVRSKTGL